MQFHPNLVPIDGSKWENVIAVVGIMKSICLFNPDEGIEYIASKTVEEANQKAVNLAEKLVNSGRRRVVEIDKKHVVLVISYQSDHKMWHLSMSIPNQPEPDRVPDEIATKLVGVFFGSYQEVSPKAVFSNVRHFICDENHVAN